MHPLRFRHLPEQVVFTLYAGPLTRCSLFPLLPVSPSVSLESSETTGGNQVKPGVIPFGESSTRQVLPMLFWADLPERMVFTLYAGLSTYCPSGRRVEGPEVWQFSYHQR